jgi:predicted RNA binding protein YcfA (HicA-like mRNA interferase family)
MKSTELNRLAIKLGWELVSQDSSSHRFYEKNGNIVCIPYHGAKEVPTGTCKKIIKIISTK